MSRGKTARLAWTGSHNRYKKTNAIYKEAYEKIFKKNNQALNVETEKLDKLSKKDS